MILSLYEICCRKLYYLRTIFDEIKQLPDLIQYHSILINRYKTIYNFFLTLVNGGDNTSDSSKRIASNGEEFKHVVIPKSTNELLLSGEPISNSIKLFIVHYEPVSFVDNDMHFIFKCNEEENITVLIDYMLLICEIKMIDPFLTIRNYVRKNNIYQDIYDRVHFMSPVSWDLIFKIYNNETITKVFITPEVKIYGSSDIFIRSEQEFIEFSYDEAIIFRIIVSFKSCNPNVPLKLTFLDCLVDKINESKLADIKFIHQPELEFF